MRTPAKILLAGTLVATAPWGAATSFAQSSVLNEQLSFDDIFASQTLNVEEVTDWTIGVATSTANAYDARVDGGDLELRSYQENSGALGAQVQANVGTSSGDSTTLTSNASGNIGGAAVYAGTMTAVTTQVSQGASISATGQYEGANAEAGDITSSVQALGNSQGFSTSAAVSGVRATQYNSAQINADGGGVVGDMGGTAVFSAAASANNITSAAGYGASERIIADQNNVSDLVQAAQFTAFGGAYIAHTSATASANNISAGNEGRLLDMTALQQNEAYVRAQAESSAYNYGSGTATAYGVGNSLLAGQLGEEVILDVEQFNIAGGIEAIAAYTGHDGYDAAASAMAMGNASTGYVCSDCAGRMTVNNRQVNDADVAATGTVTVTGSARTVTGAANAVGNTASYYVSRPGQ
jgi:hypothetical protein